MEKNGSKQDTTPDPLWFLAELTYRCPLACPYCYNPLNYRDIKDDLSTTEWQRVLDEARALGATQLCFSGGEPLLRVDLESLVAHARGLGFYCQISTSGVGLDERRLRALQEAGLDHVQLSFQAGTEDLNDYLSGARCFELKRELSRQIKRYGFSMLFNIVLHRHNIDQIDIILEMTDALGADYVELANCQYHAWALRNRAQLMPTREQLERAEAVTNAFRQRVADRMTIYFVVPDYHADRPKPCLGGWGSVFMIVAPDGLVLPCHDARQLPGIEFPNVRDGSLRWAWYESPAFNRFRGYGWMKEPCRSCPERERDFGGCRCQAYLLTGDAAATDPVCALSPQHDLVEAALVDAEGSKAPLQFRGRPARSSS